MIDVIAFVVIVVAVLLAVAGFADVRAQRRLDDAAQREGSRRRHPSHVRRLVRPYDWQRDDG